MPADTFGSCRIVASSVYDVTPTIVVVISAEHMVGGVVSVVVFGEAVSADLVVWHSNAMPLAPE